jgi:NitT/TauT family transport system ATP-binding protein
VPTLRLAAVGKTYTAHDAVEAVHTVDLDVAAGELVCLVGPRGSGTSTLLAMVAGLEPATRGRITSGGRRVKGSGPDRALLIKDAGLLPWLDARRNVELALRHRRLAAFDRAAIARRCLDLVSMHRFESTPAVELSAAQQHRVALARALAADPVVLLMDEPFADLDPKARVAMYDELQAVWTATRKTIVFATHDPLEAVTLGDRVLVLSPRPARVLAELAVGLPRPRRADDPAVQACARDVLLGLRAAAA